MFADKNKVFTVKGRIIDQKTRKGVKGLRVEVWDKDILTPDDPLGEAVTNEQGVFQVMFDESQFSFLSLDGIPDLYFKLFQDYLPVVIENHTIESNAEKKVFSVTLTVSIVSTTPVNNLEYRVSGWVRDMNGAPLSGYKVIAWDRYQQKNTQLGETKSNPQGFYEIKFKDTDFKENDRERNAPNLLVRAYNQNGTEIGNARKDNAPLDTRIDIDSQTGSDHYIINGHVYAKNTNTRLAVANIKIEAYERINNKDFRPLGSTSSNQAGLYQIVFNRSTPAQGESECESLILKIKAFDTKGTLIGESKPICIINRETEQDVDIILYRVYGTVTGTDRMPQSGIKVTALDRDMRKRQLLGECETNDSGDYIIDYQQSDFSRGELPSSATPWLIVEAREDAEQSPLDVQEFRKADPIQRIDLTVPVSVISEWQRLSQTITPLLKDQGDSPTSSGQGNGADLEPADLTVSDLEFIIVETGFDRAAVEAWAASSKIVREAIKLLGENHSSEKNLIAENDTGWPFFFGFVRQGLANDLNALLNASAASWQSTWNAAFAASQVPLIEEIRLQQLFAALMLLQRLGQLSPATNRNSELVQVLAHTPLPSAVALEALAIFQEKGLEDVQAFLDLANQHPQVAAEIKTFARGVQVHQLVAGHSGLSRVLNEHLDSTQNSKGIMDRIRGGKQFSLESIEPLATLSSMQWLGVAEQASVGGDYVLQLQAQVENLYPVTALQTRIKTEEVKFPAVTSNEIVSFIREKEETATSIMQGAYPLNDLEGKPPVYRTLSNIGLFQRLGISMEHSSYLMEAGIGSPGAAMSTSLANLESIMLERSDLPGEVVTPIVSAFYHGALSILSATTNFITSSSTVWQMSILQPWFILNQSTIKPITDNLPSITNLFGDLDQCLCRDCESMLSQSAYLVDLLNLLRGEGEKGLGLTLEALKKRRSDISKLPLGCESEEEIQYITLVLEILEKEVKNIPPNTDAYQQTANAVFPWRFLPFDADYVKVQAYLKKLNVKRYDFLALQADANENSDSEDFKNFKMFLAAETFELTVSQSAQGGSISEWDLITKPRIQGQLWQVYGFANGGNIVIKDPVSGENINESVGNALSRISVLLDRSGLTLDELEEIITIDEDPEKEPQTKFVPGTGGKLIIDKREQCKTSEMRLRLEGSANLEACLDRLHRLVRLHRKLPDWSISQLDQAIVANGNILDASMMTMLAIIHRLNKTLGLPLEYLLDLPRSEAKLRLSLKLSPQQYLLMSAMTGFDLSTKPTDQTALEKYWIPLEKWCGTIARIRNSKLTIEHVAAAVLPYPDLQKHLPLTQTTEQIEKYLEVVQERLRAVKAERDDSDAETQGNELLTIIFGPDEARKLFAAINSQGELKEEQKKYLKEKLTNPKDTIRKLGEWQPLFTEAQADSIFNVDQATDRFKKFLEEILIIRQERELIAVITEQCKLPEADVVALLSYRMLLDAQGSESQTASDSFLAKTFWEGQTPPKVSEENMPRLHKWMDRLFRLAALIPVMKLDSALFQLADRVIVDNPAIKGINWHEILAAGKAVNGKHFTALLDLFWLQSEEQLSRDIIINLFNQLDGLAGDAVEPAQLSSVATRVGLADNQALKIVTQAVLPLINRRSGDTIKKNQLYDPRRLTRAFRLLLKAQQLGATDIELQQIADLTNNKQAAETVLKRVQANASLNDEDWKKTSSKINDLLMQQQRNALVDYLVVNNKNNLRNVDDLYEHYLIDPRIEPCFKTSKLNEAISATQLFIHRILFGLERGIVASEQLRNWWVWMRNYRVWEANRKVFLFPENWLFPELRDDKSSSFTQLESKLGQSELTQELAEQAFAEFLDDVAQMGQIQVLGMYEDISQEDDIPIQFGGKGFTLRRKLYVIGRTNNPPYAYFWRSCEDFSDSLMEWTPWQRIELDIIGDHILPFVLNNNFYIAWPLIKRIPQGENNRDKWQIKLAWSRYDGKNWKRISISRDSWNGDVADFSDERRGFTFRQTTDLHQTKVKIHAYAMSSMSLMEGNKSNTEDSYKYFYDNYFPPYIENVDQHPEYLNKLRSLASLLTAEYANIPELELGDPSSYPANPIPESDDLPLKNHIETYCMKMFMVPYDPTYALMTVIFAFPTLAGNIHYTAMKNNRNLIGLRPSDDFCKSKIYQFLFDFRYSKTVSITPLGDDLAVQIRFQQMFDTQLAPNFSMRELSCRAWIKLLTPDGAPGKLELTGQEGKYSCRIDSEAINLMPGQASPTIIAKLTKLPETTCYLDLILTINGNEKTFSSTQTLLNVEKGKKVTQTLEFIFDASNENPEDLGFDLNAGRELVLVAEFELSREEKIFITKPNQIQFVNTVNYSQVWMNGYQENQVENDKSNQPLRIAYPGRSEINIFNPTLDQQFWMLPASTKDTWLPSLWHYSEGEVSCYIDLSVIYSSRKDSLAIYPNSYEEPMAWRSLWYENKIPLSNEQKSTFKADHMPHIELSQNSTDWNEAINGDLIFDSRMPYACYNWEVFFHAPLMIADQLSRQHKFEDAERWLRYVFDPTAHKPGEGAKGALNFRVFREDDFFDKQVIDDLTALAQAAGGFATNANIKTIDNLITRWRNMPFRPFIIARQRHIAFLWRTLFAYLDNLIAWADSLYRQDRRESLIEAQMLYGLAGKILGRRPQQHQSKSKRKSESFDDMADKWDSFANFWINTVTSTNSTNPKTSLKQFKSNKPLDDRPPTRPRDGENRPYPNPNGMLYFCMPWNEKITGYWRIIDDRLFNLRNCKNIEGIERELPLTDPQIDPELLVRAMAAGLNLSDVISGLYAPPPHYRYAILSARAAELANEVKALGAAMLSAIEKRDAEEMARLRSSNEISMLKLVQEVREEQIEEAKNNLTALEATRKTTGARYSQYQRLLGKKDIKIPEPNASASEESMLGNIDGLASERSKWGLIREENEQYRGIEGANTWSIASAIAKVASGGFQTAAAAASAYPPVHSALSATGHGVSAVGDGLSITSQMWRIYADQQGMMAGHIRRRDEWAFQSNQALKELQQIDKQILANKIRIAITEKELANHNEQIDQAKAVDEVMRSKFSNQQLYQWMMTQLSGLYFNAHRMALDMARSAERAAARELGVQSLNILRNDYWDSLRNGLLAGERLHQDLKRLEISFLEQNRREFELTKHISLRRLNPEALVQLRLKDAQCEFDVPEWLFDLDTPGHYMRRIKSVSVSIPCVTGPYTNVSCTLTLLKSRIRHDRIATETDYAQDNHFTDYFGATEAIVTSNANADSGMFETQLKDERFLPFESSGVISSWRLELPADFPQFDYSTISDVILTIRYTARDGGKLLKEAATGSINSLLNPVTSPLIPSEKSPRFPVLLGCRSDFSTEWALARNTNSNLKIQINNDLLPYWMEAASLEIKKVSTMPLKKDSKELSFSQVWPEKEPKDSDTTPELPKPILSVSKLTGLENINIAGSETVDYLILLSLGKNAATAG